MPIFQTKIIGFVVSALFSLDLIQNKTSGATNLNENNWIDKLNLIKSFSNFILCVSFDSIASIETTMKFQAVFGKCLHISKDTSSQLIQYSWQLNKYVIDIIWVWLLNTCVVKTGQVECMMIQLLWLESFKNCLNNNELHICISNEF